MLLTRNKENSDLLGFCYHKEQSNAITTFAK